MTGQPAAPRVYPSEDWLRGTGEMVWCPGCAFGFGAEHVTTGTNEYDCPNCGARSEPMQPCGHPLSDETSADGHTFCAVCAVRPAAPASETVSAGLHDKYHGLRRTRDDSEVEGWYFVLRPYSPEKGSYDRAAVAAMRAYADACESYAPELASDLRRRTEGFEWEDRWQRQYLAEWER